MPGVTNNPPPRGWRIWLLAARPKTLPAAVAPVLIGTAMAYADGGLHAPTALLALAGALLLQVGTNFCNDYADFKKGADTAERVGPLRATQAGLVSPESMRRAAMLTFASAGLVCAYFVLRGGWPYAVLGVLAVLSGWAYTAGPYPLGYLGLGDAFVFVFFGPVAVAGTYHLQTLAFSWTPVAAGCAAGLLSVAILVANNLRDAETDGAAGKRTLVVRFGLAFGRWEYTLCIAGASAIAALLSYGNAAHRAGALACIVLAPAAPLVRKVWTGTGRDLAPVLAGTARLLLLFAVLFSAGWLL